MGVLNFSGILECREKISLDLINVLEDEEVVYEVSPTCFESLKSCSKRKRSKSNSGVYDFRDYVIDKRRSGSKHQRRKENMSELVQIAGEDADQWSCDNIVVTAFTDLFLDNEKMKIWESFINLTDDEQQQVLNTSYLQKQPVNDVFDTEDMRYLQIDQKIRGILQSKHMMSMGLLKYYEKDIMSCMEDEFPSLLVLNLEEKFDRMLVYAICQFFDLLVSRIRLKTTTLIEIELPTATSAELIPRHSLTGYLEKTSRKLSRTI